MLANDPQVLGTTATFINLFWLGFKIGLLLIAVLYFAFSLIMIRQINLLTEVLMTQAAPVLKALAVIFAGLALAIIVFLIGIFF